MATINIMKNKQTQNQKGLAFVLAYCQRKSKTTYEGKKLVSGINCVPESVFQEFMNTKRKHQKTDGRTFYHFTQSFHPDEQITPDLAHQSLCGLPRKISRILKYLWQRIRTESISTPTSSSTA